MKGNYKGVSEIKTDMKGTIKYKASAYVNGYAWQKIFDTEREAARAYDIKMIEIGRPPVNILKPLNHDK